MLDNSFFFSFGVVFRNGGRFDVKFLRYVLLIVVV